MTDFPETATYKRAALDEVVDRRESDADETRVHPAARTDPRGCYLGNYLLVKGHHTYLDYFAAGPLEWYPEWAIDLGAPTTAATDVTALASGGVYRRDFANGSVLVNPTSSAVNVSLGGTYNQVVPSGGGAVDANGDTPGTLSMQSVTQVSVGATAAVLVLK